MVAVGPRRLALRARDDVVRRDGGLPGGVLAVGGRIAPPPATRSGPRRRRRGQHLGVAGTARLETTASGPSRSADAGPRAGSAQTGGPHSVSVRSRRPRRTRRNVLGPGQAGAPLDSDPRVRGPRRYPHRNTGQLGITRAVLDQGPLHQRQVGPAEPARDPPSISSRYAAVSAPAYRRHHDGPAAALRSSGSSLTFTTSTRPGPGRAGTPPRPSSSRARLADRGCPSSR